MPKHKPRHKTGFPAKFVRPDWSIQLVVLGLFLTLAFATGGSSRYDNPQLLALRPLAILAAGFALVTFTAQHWRAYRPLWLLSASVVLVPVLHLVPLPPDIWQALPGRDIVVEIGTIAGLNDLWRPLTMFPEGTWNALYALSVPAAVLLLGAQLNERDLMRLLVWIIALGVISGMIGVMQAAGSDLRFYRISTAAGGLFANRNHQAALLACLFPMLAAWAIAGSHSGKATRAKHLAAGAMALTLVPLILVTGSRMGLALAGLAFIYSSLMLLRHRHGREFSRRAKVAQVAAGSLAVAGVIAATFVMSRDVAFDRLGDASSEARWPIWGTIIDFLPEYLPWGSGVGSFVPVYQIHERDGMLLPTYVNQAHNDWLDLVLTAGIPGVLIAFAALAMLALAVRGAWSASGTIGHLRRAGLGIILVLAFASLSDYPVRTPILSAVLAVAAILVAAAHGPSRRFESTTQNATA